MGIGDGTNDVAMIKAAHVGIGIKGVEGTEAAANSDYAIGTFKHVERLMFVHGRQFAYRQELFVYTFMYKSLLSSLCGMMLGFYNGYSGLKMYADIYYAGFTVWVCNLDVLQFIMAEQDIPLNKNHTP